MKKLIYILLSLVLITGCTDLSNTPTKKTEEFLKKYQTLDSNVMTDLNKVVEEEVTFSRAQKEKYKTIMKKHYQNITYEIKEDEINGDDAKVTAEIEVTDFRKVINETNTYLQEHTEEFLDELGNYNNSKYNDYRLESLSNAKDKVKYTIDIYLTKVDGKWKVNTPSQDVLDKINGIYNY